MTATSVPLWVFNSHSEAITIETERPLSPAQAREILSRAPGVEVVDDPSRLLYMTPREAAGKDAIYVSRIRADESVENGLHLWVVSDNLRKGAALNAVQIAEVLIRDHL